MRTTPLMLAARDNHSDVLKLLIARGAKANAKDDRGFTAMSFALGKRRQDHSAVVKVLRAAGARP